MMPVLDRAHRALDRISRWPGIRGLLQWRYDRLFAANPGHNLFRGVFDTFEAAGKATPGTRPLGYDNPASAGMYLDRTRKTYATDYPVLFWLQKLLYAGSRSVFDLGGHIGVSYYAYRRYLEHVDGLRWRVHDVPAVMAQGRALAAERDPDGRLTFCDRFEDAADSDILLAMGSLQYLPETLSERLAKLPRRPPHVLVNLTPLHESHSYFTLQSIGTAYCAYRVTAIEEFLQGFAALGYTLVDSWDNPEKKCGIPFRPDRSLELYRGFYFRLAS